MVELSGNAPRRSADSLLRSWHTVARDASGRFSGSRSAGWPPVIAFLARIGVAPGLLLTAMTNRWREGVSADAALLALPGVDADNFYRSLASCLGVRFETGPVRFDNSVRWPLANRVGIAATIAADGSIIWLVAPRGRSLEALVKAYSRGEIPRDRVVITSPARFSAMVGAARGGAIRQRASFGLSAAVGNDFSAMKGASCGQRIAAAIAVVYLALAFGVGGIAWASLSIFCSVVLAGAILLRLFATAESCESDDRRPAPSLADYQLPIYSIIVPLYREAKIVRRLVAALDALDYPGIMAQPPQAISRFPL